MPTALPSATPAPCKCSYAKGAATQVWPDPSRIIGTHDALSTFIAWSAPPRAAHAATDDIDFGLPVETVVLAEQCALT